MEILPQFIVFVIQIFLVTYHHMYVIQSGYEEGWEVYLTFFTIIAIS